MNLVPSPCINVCRIDARHGWCEGCQRTLDEIAAWSRLDDVGKRLVWKRLPERRRIVAATPVVDPAADPTVGPA